MRDMKSRKKVRMREDIGAKCYNGSDAAEIICKQKKRLFSHLILLWKKYGYTFAL